MVHNSKHKIIADVAMPLNDFSSCHGISELPVRMELEIIENNKPII